jgi:hypothetical protein
VYLERGPLSLVSSIEALLERKNSSYGLENRDYGLTDYATPFYPQYLMLASPTSGDRSFGIVRSRIQATEFAFVCWFLRKMWTLDGPFH